VPSDKHNAAVSRPRRVRIKVLHLVRLDLHLYLDVKYLWRAVAIMRFALNFLWLSLAAGATVRSPVASQHDGSRVYRVKAGRQLTSVHKRLAGIVSDYWDQAHGNLDVVIPRDQIDAFEALGLNTRMLHADLGESIAKESHVKRANWKRQANDTQDPWFDSYHPYADVSLELLPQPRRYLMFKLARRVVA
jgi:hypothetical protein